MLKLTLRQAFEGSPAAPRSMVGAPAAGRLDWAAIVQAIAQHPACLALLGLLVAAGLLASDFTAATARLADSLGDTDDATRLMQVRAYLDGAGWFDTTLHQFGAAPLLSHWSRLVDVPLAAGLSVLTVAMPADAAETVVRMAWPSLLLAATLALVARAAQREAGGYAGVIALALAATSPFALLQFGPGRIDHHNVMILLTTVGLAGLAGAVDDRAFGRWAGVALGLALVVGFEPIGLVVAGLALLAVLSLTRPVARPGAEAAAFWFAATLVGGFAVSVPPSRWFDGMCDALGLNLVLLAVTAAAGLALANRLVSDSSDHWRTFIARAAIVAVCGATGLAAYVALDPVCLKGPFGGLDPRVKAIWLDHVREGHSLLSFLAEKPAGTIATILFLAAGLVAAVLDAVYRRDPRAVLRCGLMVSAAFYAMIFTKLVPYATWLAVFVLAVVIARLPAWLGQPARTIRLAAAVLVWPGTLMVGLGLLVKATGLDPVGDTHSADAARSCELRADYEAFARLPTGLVVGDIDLGPHIAAHGPHRVLAAPYHRMSRDILRAHEILSATPNSAHQALIANGARYVALCVEPRATLISKPPLATSRVPAPDPTSLAERLRRDDTIAGFTPLFLHASPSERTGLRIWRVEARVQKRL